MELSQFLSQDSSFHSEFILRSSNSEEVLHRRSASPCADGDSPHGNIRTLMQESVRDLLVTSACLPAAISRSLSAAEDPPPCPNHHREPLIRTLPSSSPASARSPLLRQLRVLCLDEELSEDEEKAAGAASPGPFMPACDQPAVGPFQVLLRSVPGAADGRAEEEQPSERVTLRRSEEESFGLDLEITSSPLIVTVAGIKPGSAAAWVRFKTFAPRCVGGHIHMLSPAFVFFQESAGRLRAGDQVLRVGDTWVHSCSYQEVCELMHTLPLTLELEVRRAAGETRAPP